MEGISSTPIENSVQFLRLRDKYKSDIFEDSRLTKAAGLAAKKELLLNSSAPDTWKEPRVKAVNRELQQWVKKIRQPGGTRAITRDDDDTDDDEDNLAVAPIHRLMGNISKIRQGIKRQAESVTPQLQTPAIKQSPSSGKKPKFSFKPGSKAKKWSIKKTPKKFKTPSPPSSVVSTPDEGATGYTLPDTGLLEEEEEEFTPGTPLQTSLQKFKASTKKEFSDKLEKAKQRALKKIAPAPGWKPFGTPAKRRLHGKDW